MDVMDMRMLYGRYADDGWLLLLLCEGQRPSRMSGARHRGDTSLNPALAGLH